MTQLIPGSEPFLLRGGPSACLLLHGFSATPEEMRPLGEFLAGRGHTVLGVRLAGHATHPADLSRTLWTDWLLDVENGLALLRNTAERVFLVGQSLGGMIALTAASRYPIAGVVAMSTPTGQPPALMRWVARLQARFNRMRPKQAARYPKGHPLHARREADYPAYPSTPARITPQVFELMAAMQESLPQVTVPALIIHAEGDQLVPLSSQAAILKKLGSPGKQALTLPGMSHGLTLDPGAAPVFQAIAEFVERVAAE